MKFEEVLPAMRDEGRIGIWKKLRFRIHDGKLEYDSGYMGGMWNPWTSDDDLGELLLGQWSLEPREVKKVKKWFWIFGRNDEVYASPKFPMTDEEAIEYLWTHGLDWKHKVDETGKEFEE